MATGIFDETGNELPEYMMEVWEEAVRTLKKGNKVIHHNCYNRDVKTLATIEKEPYYFSGKVFVKVVLDEGEWDGMIEAVRVRDISLPR